MKKTFILVVAAGSSFFIMRLSTFVIPESICIMLSLVFVVALLVLLVTASRTGIIKWRKTSRLWPVPALVCLVFILCGFGITPSMGRYISDWQFKKNLDQYSIVVDNFRTGIISCTSSCNGDVEVIGVTSRPVRIRDIWGARCDDRGVIVLFRFDTDVPLLHEGYFFRDYGENSNCGIRSVSPELGWPHTPYVRHITGHWYHFSDQPGL